MAKQSFTEEDEKEISIREEALYRANKRLKADDKTEQEAAKAKADAEEAERKKKEAENVPAPETKKHWWE